MTERTALYRLYDSSDRLLYVGITADLEQRWAGHHYSPTSTWWPRVHRKVIEWHVTREAADEAETVAIAGEKPLHNKAKKPGGYIVRPSRVSSELKSRNPHLDPYSQQAIRILSAEIESGAIAPGAVLPTAKELHRRFGLSANTCGGMLRSMATQGLIHQKAKGGRYYCSVPGEAVPAHLGARKPPTLREAATLMQAVAIEGIMVDVVERRTRARINSRSVLGAHLQVRPYSPDPSLRMPHVNVELAPNEVIEFDGNGLAEFIDQLEAQCAALRELHDQLLKAEVRKAA